jgi:cysteinyl-tRNA synthetase
MMQAHYSSVLDFSNDALLAAEKGHDRLLSALEKLDTLEPSKESTIALQPWIDKCYQAMSDNFNTPILIAHLFEAIKWISTAEGTIGLDADDLVTFKTTLHAFTFELLGLRSKSVDSSDAHKDALDKAMSLVIELRAQARLNKDWGTADLIRDQLQEAGIQLKDGADGTSYSL